MALDSLIVLSSGRPFSTINYPSSFNIAVGPCFASAHSRGRECAVAGSRVRGRGAESAHSQGRECAVAKPRVRGREKKGGIDNE